MAVADATYLVDVDSNGLGRGHGLVQGPCEAVDENRINTDRGLTAGGQPKTHSGANSLCLMYRPAAKHGANDADVDNTSLTRKDTIINHLLCLQIMHELFITGFKNTLS